MIKNNKIISLWGILDLCSIGWFIGTRIYHDRIPFYNDLLEAKKLALSLEYQLPFVLAIISLALYVTLIISGVLLLKQNKWGAIVSYFQTPFRFIFYLFPPSIFFIEWPVRHIINVKETSLTVVIIIFVLLRIISEVPKLYTIIRWHKKINKTYNQRMHSNAYQKA